MDEALSVCSRRSSTEKDQRNKYSDLHSGEDHHYCFTLPYQSHVCHKKKESVFNNCDSDQNFVEFENGNFNDDGTFLVTERPAENFLVEERPRESLAIPPKKGQSLLKKNGMRSKLKDEKKAQIEEKLAVEGAIKKLFTGELESSSIPALERLKIEELKVTEVMSILHTKKFGVETSDIKKIITNFASKSVKRPEEMLKFAFSNNYKGIILSLFETNDREKGKKNIENDIIINEWIRPEAEKNKLDVEFYLLPLKGQNSEACSRTFSIDYIELLKNSGKLASEILKQNGIQRSLAKKATEEKVTRFIKELRKNIQKEVNFECLKNYFQKKFSKVPWTSCEQEVAYDFVEEKLTK